jgi:diguanylate cyclase (GGDEF)-like protein/PAS domain S-box-containing protein
LLPNIEPHWIERYGAVALTGDCQQFDDFSSDLDRQYRVTVYRPEPQQFAVIVDDITALRRHEESLRQAATVFEQTRDGVAITDASARIIAVNRAFSKITGYSSEEVVGRNTSLLKSGHHDAAFYAAMWSQLTGKGFWEGEVCNRRKNGEHYPQWLTISAVLNERNEIERYIGVFTDISRIRNAEAHAEFIAYHDALTRLPNRSLLNIRYQHALDRARRHDHKLALLILDLDLFRNINDSLGHEFGDRLLVAITERFKSRLRDEDTLARLHGDEFAVLMEDVEVSADAAVVARDLLKALEAPFRIGSADDIYIGASIGISISPDDGCDPALLMRNADTAVNLAKAQGRKTFCFYTESLTTLALERMRLESSLRKAIELEHLVLHYQPLIEARTGAVIGSEALVRWPDPGTGNDCADALHSGGRGLRADRTAWRLGSADRLSADESLARCRATLADHRRQCLAAPVLPAGRPGTRPTDARGHRPRRALP